MSHLPSPTRAARRGQQKAPRAELVRAWRMKMTAPTQRHPTAWTTTMWMTDTSLAKVMALTAARSFKTLVQWIPPKHMAGRRSCLTLNFFLPPLCTHALLPYLSSPPPMFFHLLSFSLWTFPTLLTPPCGSLETCVRAIAHDNGTVQTTMRKEGLGKN